MADDLGAMRRSYDPAPFEEADLAATWLAQLERWLEDAVAAGLREPNAMVLATASAEGVPSARTVLLKGLDERGLTFFTNLRSRKGRDLEQNAHAAVVFPWIELERQVVVDGRVEGVPPEEADAYFASRPRGSRLSALASPQSQVVSSREELEARLDQAGREHPGEPPRPEWWGGLRIVPSQVEFWQGRPNRLHDRLRFRGEGESWLVERLAP